MSAAPASGGGPPIPAGQLGEQIQARLRSMEQAGATRRIWERDHTLWKPDPTEISDRLGWLDLPDSMQARVPELDAFASEAASGGADTAVLMGMGGSSLAPQVLAAAGGGAKALRLIVLDSTHPSTIARVLGSIDPARTVFIVASKSGTTLETRSHFAFFYEKAGSGRRFVAITDPGTPLEAAAREKDFGSTFLNPPDLGGRFSALSLFGLVPAALSGVDLKDLLASAAGMASSCGPGVPAGENPGAVLGAAMGEAALRGRDKATIVLPGDMAGLGDWIEQLIAESTGKEGRGILPVVGEDLGPPEVYGADRLFLAGSDTAALEPLEGSGQPVLRLGEAAMGELGAEFFRWELATAIAGHILGINAFDQPNVAGAKEATGRILAGEDAPAPALTDPSDLLEKLKPGDYVSIQAYLDRTPQTEAALRRARLAIRDRCRSAVTVGFGPRFLHSTGQLHKGGPASGAFIQVVDRSPPPDLPIPGAPFTFGQLIQAQALGDFWSLKDAGRRIARVDLDGLAML